jgi:hypothetical protein
MVASILRIYALNFSLNKIVGPQNWISVTEEEEEEEEKRCVFDKTLNIFDWLLSYMLNTQLRNFSTL